MSILSSVTSLATGGQSTLYKWGAIVGGILVIAIGSFFYGKHLGDLQSKEQIASYVDQRDKALLAIQALQNNTNVKVITKFVTRTQVIHDHNDQIQEDIKKLTDSMLLSDDWLRIYNDSISELPDSTSEANGSATGIKATEALSGIANNNSICLSYKAQLEALQDWQRQTQANIQKSQVKK